ncbi:MAG: hypothetical protein ACU84H_01560 [Gammaproteobacteria bacterium]
MKHYGNIYQFAQLAGRGTEQVLDFSANFTPVSRATMIQALNMKISLDMIILGLLAIGAWLS